MKEFKPVAGRVAGWLLVFFGILILYKDRLAWMTFKQVVRSDWGPLLLEQIFIRLIVSVFLIGIGTGLVRQEVWWRTAARMFYDFLAILGVIVSIILALVTIAMDSFPLTVLRIQIFLRLIVSLSLVAIGIGFQRQRIWTRNIVNFLRGAFALVGIGWVLLTVYSLYPLSS